jgi:hypothetical protein
MGVMSIFTVCSFVFDLLKGCAMIVAIWFNFQLRQQPGKNPYNDSQHALKMPCLGVTVFRTLLCFLRLAETLKFQVSRT